MIKLVPVNSQLAGNLAAFGTPWGGGSRRTRRFEEKRREVMMPRMDILRKAHMPWFETMGGGDK